MFLRENGERFRTRGREDERPPAIATIGRADRIRIRSTKAPPHRRHLAAPCRRNVQRRGYAELMRACPPTFRKRLLSVLNDSRRVGNVSAPSRGAAETPRERRRVARREPRRAGAGERARHVAVTGACRRRSCRPPQWRPRGNARSHVEHRNRATPGSVSSRKCRANRSAGPRNCCTIICRRRAGADGTQQVRDRVP